MVDTHPEATDGTQTVTTADSSAENVSFSAILNPINPSRVLIYRIAPNNYTLGFDQRPLLTDTSVPRSNPDPAKLASTILDPTSNIVALKFNDTVNVYGVAATSKIVALLSPFVEPITPEVKATNGIIAGCTAGDKAWIAYQKQNVKKENVIYYSEVSAPKANNSSFAADNVRDKTALSLFHDTKRLWVVYQEPEGKLVAYNHKDQSSTDVAPDKSQFIKGTPITSVFVSADKIDTTKAPKFKSSNLLGRVIIYWVKSYNDSPVLYRSYADVDSKFTVLQFSTPTSATSDSVTVHLTAQIGSVMDKQEQVNRLYVSKLGEDNITQVTDSWLPDDDSGKGGKDGTKE
ncbi:MAG: hypothetical protein Q9195_004530 [Heterodermia aff. obscurata]